MRSTFAAFALDKSASSATESDSTAEELDSPSNESTSI